MIQWETLHYVLPQKHLPMTSFSTLVMTITAAVKNEFYFQIQPALSQTAGRWMWLHYMFPQKWIYLRNTSSFIPSQQFLLSKCSFFVMQLANKDFHLSSVWVSGSEKRKSLKRSKLQQHTRFNLWNRDLQKC